MFSSAPFPQDVAFSGYLDQWRKLFAISVAFPAHHSHPGANLDFYACVKEVGALWNLHSDVNTGCIIRSSAPFDTQLLTVLTMSLKRRDSVYAGPVLHAELERVVPLQQVHTLCGGTGSRSRWYRAPSSFCVALRVQCTNIVLLFQTPLSTSKGIWKHGSTSSTKTIITVTSAARADARVVRELTFKEGKPGILPELQRSRCRTPEGVYLSG